MNWDFQLSSNRELDRLTIKTLSLSDSYLPDLAKTEKESSSCSSDRRHLGKVHPEKRHKAEVRPSAKENHNSGLADDSLDGNPLYGTTLE